MNKKAFPVSRPDLICNEGMTLREWYAGQALIAVITKGVFPNTRDYIQEITELSFKLADSMLKESEKTK